MQLSSDRSSKGTDEKYDLRSDQLRPYESELHLPYPFSRLKYGKKKIKNKQL